MALRRTIPVRWSPRGCSDAVDGTNAFNGAMAQLANLIPDPSTRGVFVPRPAMAQQTAFPGISSPGFVSAALVVGDVVYGMIASARNAGKDEPFVFDLSTGAFRAVAGITALNTPTSPPPAGDWTPPIMAQVGSRIIVCHPGFAGAGVKFGWFDISGLNSTTITGTTHSSTLIDTLSSNPIAAGWQPGDTIAGAGIPANTTIATLTATSVTLSQPATSSGAGVALTVAGGTAAVPLWGAGDTTPNALPSAPVSVVQFNGRAYYACGINGIPYSDILAPCIRTLGTQALTTNDGLAVTALGPLMLSAPLTGGIAQAVIAFEADVKMQQITGDAALGTLAMNALSVATGTLAPLSIAPCKSGLSFVSPDGLRIVGFDGSVSPPIGDAGGGITVPFTLSLYQSRICAAANRAVIRITTTRGDGGGDPTEEWWYDLNRQIWTGPHSCAASLIQPWRQSFLVSPAIAGMPPSLWQSDVTARLSSSYSENGSALAWTYETILLPDNDMMAMNNLVEANLAAVASPSIGLAVAVHDELDTELDAISLQFGSLAERIQQRSLDWTQPIIFKQMSVIVSGPSDPSVRVGNLYLGYQILGYNNSNTIAAEERLLSDAGIPLLADDGTPLVPG